MRLALAGGGTGGHLVPGLHLIERLKAAPTSSADSEDGEAGLPPLSDLLWFTGGRPVEDRVLEGFEAPCDWERVPMHLDEVGGGAPSKLRLGLRLPAAVRRARERLRAHKTQVLLGLGGYATVPAAMAARTLGIPVALLEINAAPGKATRVLMPWVQRVYHAWTSTFEVRQGSARHRLVGAPVSPAVVRVGQQAGDEAEARAALGFQQESPLLLVLGGSQGAGSLNQFMGERMEFITEAGVQVLHQCGPGRRAELPADRPRFKVVEYVNPVAQALEAATLVLCRGGASTLAEIAAARQPAVVVPYPHHGDRHQERNALELGSGVRVVADESLDSSLAHELVELCSSQAAERRRAMRQTLEQRAPSDAAKQILCDLARLGLGGSAR